MLSPLTPLDRLRDSIRAQREAVVTQLREHLSTLDPYQFEHLIRDLLEKMSFRDCQVTQQYKDGGIDLTASFSIGITEIRTICQVKRQRAPIGIPAIQQFYGAMATLQVQNRALLGLFVTTSRFAGGAAKWVEQSSLPLVLIDGDRLAELLVEHGLLVREVPLQNALELDLGPATVYTGPAPDAENATGDDAFPEHSLRRPRLFRWRLTEGQAGEFVLVAQYLPDRQRDGKFRGIKVAPEEDFKAARTHLHRQIAEYMRPLFPDLAEDRLHARAWSGVHKVYPAKVYGR
jgi:hypothetical protein